MYAEQKMADLVTRGVSPQTALMITGALNKMELLTSGSTEGVDPKKVESIKRLQLALEHLAPSAEYSHISPIVETICLFMARPKSVGEVNLLLSNYFSKLIEDTNTSQ